LVTIDTADVTKMVIIPKLGGGDNITFTKSGNDWLLESGGISYKPDLSSIKNIMAELARMRTERVAGIDESKWVELEVTDSTATRVQLFDGDDIITDLYLGKFTYSQAPQTQNPYQQQQRARMFSHVRPVDEKVVYVVEGFLKMNIQPNINNYRAKTLASLKKEDITKITFKYPQNDNFTIMNQNGKWFLDGAEADSVKTARYLQKYARLTSNNFVDENSALSDVPSHTLIVEGNNTFPIELRAYPSSDTTHKFLITSSLTPDSKYSGDKGKLFERMFVNRDEFFNLPEEE